MRKKELEEQIKDENFFLRFLAVNLANFKEDPCTAMHDINCQLNDEANFETWKKFHPTKKVWQHEPEYVNLLCNCKIKVIIETLYNIKERLADTKYKQLMENINNPNKSKRKNVKDS